MTEPIIRDQQMCFLTGISFEQSSTKQRQIINHFSKFIVYIKAVKKFKRIIICHPFCLRNCTYLLAEKILVIVRFT